MTAEWINCFRTTWVEVTESGERKKHTYDEVKGPFISEAEAVSDGIQGRYEKMEYLYTIRKTGVDAAVINLLDEIEYKECIDGQENGSNECTCGGHEWCPAEPDVGYPFPYLGLR